jgi:hypothetical protein
MAKQRPINPKKKHRTKPKSLPARKPASLPTKPQAPAPKKHVRFAEKLDNDSSLDSSMRERIEHNLKYNDDTIFDGISIFQDLNSSGFTLHAKKVAEKERYPKAPVVDEEDEEECIEVRAEEEVKQQQISNIEPSYEDKSRLDEDQSGGGQEFWALMAGGGQRV